MPGGTQLHLIGIKTPSSPSVAPPPAPEPMLRPLLPSSALSGLQAGAQQSHPKRRIAFYSHRADPFLVPKLPAIQSGKRGVEMGGGAVRWYVERSPGRMQVSSQPSLPAQWLLAQPALRVLQVGRLPGRGRWRALRYCSCRQQSSRQGPVAPRRLISWFTLYGRASMGAGGCRGGFRPGPQHLPAATSRPKVEPQLVMKVQQRLSGQSKSCSFLLGPCACLVTCCSAQLRKQTWTNPTLLRRCLQRNLNTHVP